MWNEREWEHSTDEEALDEGPIAEMTVPGLLAYVRGLLLTEVMPDALSPANPRPTVVADLLAFLAGRIVELEDGVESADTELGSGIDESIGADLDRLDIIVGKPVLGGE